MQSLLTAKADAEAADETIAAAERIAKVLACADARNRTATAAARFNNRHKAEDAERNAKPSRDAQVHDRDGPEQENRPQSMRPRCASAVQNECCTNQQTASGRQRPRTCPDTTARVPCERQTETQPN